MLTDKTAIEIFVWMELEDKYGRKSKKIIQVCLQEKSTNPVKIFNTIAHMDFIRMHGPEHHVLDGAALSIIDETGPLSTDSSWGKHMEFTSKALESLSNVGGPRCCKRDSFLSFEKAIDYIKDSVFRNNGKQSLSYL